MDPAGLPESAPPGSAVIGEPTPPYAGSREGYQERIRVAKLTFLAER